MSVRLLSVAKAIAIGAAAFSVAMIAPVGLVIVVTFAIAGVSLVIEGVSDELANRKKKDESKRDTAKS